MKKLAHIFTIICLVGVVGGCCASKIRPGFFSSNEQIRSRLLSYTPIGASGSNVLDFVVNKMCNVCVSVCAYTAYVDALPAVSPRELTVVREPETQGGITYGRCIWVRTYPVGMTSTQVS